MAAELEAILTLVFLQLVRIIPFWVTGLLAGSLVSVFLSGRLGDAVARIGAGKAVTAGLPAAVLLGAASPVCMYGTRASGTTRLPSGCW